MLTIRARIGLSLLPFPTLRRMFDRIALRRPRVPTLAIERIVWSVRTAARVVPRSTCLVQALAAQPLMAWHGFPCELRLGVSHGDNGAFEAHAWLEYDGRAVIGEHEAQRFTPLPGL